MKETFKLSKELLTQEIKKYVGYTFLFVIFLLTYLFFIIVISYGNHNRIIISWSLIAILILPFIGVSNFVSKHPKSSFNFYKIRLKVIPHLIVITSIFSLLAIFNGIPLSYDLFDVIRQLKELPFIQLFFVLHVFFLLVLPIIYSSILSQTHNQSISKSIHQATNMVKKAPLRLISYPLFYTISLLLIDYFLGFLLIFGIIFLLIIIPFLYIIPCASIKHHLRTVTVNTSDFGKSQKHTKLQKKG